MKIQWDPFTGQFVESGDDPPAEIGVPPRTAAKKGQEGPGAKGIKIDITDLKATAGSFGKAAAYIANKRAAEEQPEGEEQPEVDEVESIINDALGTQERQTWPELNDKMKAVIKNEEEVARETVTQNLNLAQSSVAIVVPKEGPLVSALEAALKEKGSTVVKMVGTKVSQQMFVGVNGLLIVPSGEGPKLFGGDQVFEATHVEDLLHAAAESGDLKHVVYLSGLGTERTGFQFNLDGSIDKKKAVEQSVRRLSKSLGFSFSIIRVGSLVPRKSGEDGLILEPGDTLSGSTSVPLAAEGILQSLLQPSALNTSYSIVSTKGPAPTEEEWDDNMLKLIGPEVLRVPLQHVDPRDAQIVLRAWGLQFMEGSRKLTTPVFAVRSPLGVKIYFLPTARSLGPTFAEEKAIGKARMKGDAGPSSSRSSRPILEGGLEICVDNLPLRRVRVRRIAMEERTVVKAMSERDLLNSLKEEIELMEKEAKERGGRRMHGNL